MTENFEISIRLFQTRGFGGNILGRLGQGEESGNGADGLWGSLWANIAVSRALDGQLWDENLEEASEMTFSHSPLSSRALGKFWPHLPFLASKSI